MGDTEECSAGDCHTARMDLLDRVLGHQAADVHEAEGQTELCVSDF